ncbi:MAG: HNH endonuclease [Pseudomonadota bacterium]
MAYWWVNHKQTYQQETGGGYIWSPKTRQDGGRSHFYDNMAKVAPGDIVFSYANAQIHDVGVATAAAVTAPKPSEFGRSGDGWSREGWMVPVEFHKTSQAFRPKNHIERIAPLLPEKYSPIQANGNGNQTAYLASISDDLALLLLRIIDEPRLEEKLLQGNVAAEEPFAEDELEDAVWARGDIPETDKEQIVLSRRGQGAFRKSLEQIEPCCRITRLSEREHLRASHIKPWRDSNDQERLDGNNGLLLAPHIDHLFDRGYITFDDDGLVEFSPQLTQQAAKALGVEINQYVGKFNSHQSAYLAYHRKHVFLEF